MDNHTEQFKWDDKLVQDYIQFYAASYAASVAYFNSDETLEKFKQSKSKKEEPQWEILEFKNLRSGIVYIKKDNGKFNSGNGLDWDLEKFDIKDHEIINSVKRFPDNTVWSVDMVTEHGIITAFKIVGSTMVAEIKNNIFPYDYPLYLSELKTPKETPKPEWEILKLEIGGVNYPIDALNEKEKSIAKIYSVKRLSDGEVFSVGDYVEYIFVGASDNFYTPHLIKRFEIKDGVMYVQGEVPELFSFTLVSCKKSKAPKEEQVPIKVESIAFYTSFGEKQIRDTFAVNLSNNISEDKLQSIKSAIEDELNGKTEHEKLLSKIEKKVKLANVINTHANYLRETLDLIKSLNK